MIALIAATVGLGVAAIPASAQLHSVTVFLVTGEHITTIVDVPPGASVSSATIPGITGTVRLVIDNGVISTPTPNPTPAVPVPSVTAVPGVPAIPGHQPSPTSTPTPDGNEAPGAPNRTPGGASHQGSTGARAGGQLCTDVREGSVTSER